MLSSRYWQVLAGISGFIGVAMAAVGAHAASDALLSALVERAAIYQLLHSLLLFWLAERDGRAAGLARVALALGVLLFCGSLYGKAFGGWPTTLAPAGGMLLMAGWLLAGFSAKPRNKA